ncbi:hypothetical protein [Aldersonia kunmingensis]|uniref:hypothetical protein n=1 Tax=Aldersonia kunmingensis TaxID=408066 RepID=UPI0012EE37FA|nr:hypothetical protein [Aldersonia kunmingensis]
MTTTKKDARDRARRRMAERMAAIQEREKANEADLAVVFAASETLATAERRRVATIASAEEEFRQASERATVTRVDAFARMRERGETVDSIAELTGEPVGEIRKILKNGGDAATSPAETVGAAAGVGVDGRPA